MRVLLVWRGCTRHLRERIVIRDSMLVMFFRTATIAAMTLSAVLFALALPRPATVTIPPVQAQAAPLSATTLFHERGCEHCHGADLQGTDKGPNLTGVGRRRSHAEIEHQIHDGGNEMPAFGEALDSSELAALTDYLSHQKARPAR